MRRCKVMSLLDQDWGKPLSSLVERQYRGKTLMKKISQRVKIHMSD
jgi:hypothetical protein